MVRVKTRDGRDAVIFAVAGDGIVTSFPIHGFVESLGFESWTKNGFAVYDNGSRRPWDLMLEGVDLSSVTIGANGELPKQSDADYLALCRERVKTRELSEEIKLLRSQLNDVLELLDKERKYLERLQADRLERIATAAMQGLMANSSICNSDDSNAMYAVSQAKALIEALDKEGGK